MRLPVDIGAPPPAARTHDCADVGIAQKRMAPQSRLREHRSMARFTNVLFCVFLTSRAVQADSAVDDITSSDISAHASRALAARPSNQVHEIVEVWIDLSAPPLSTLAGRDREALDALRARIKKQQDEVMSQLAPLGAEERGRVVQVRNAIAVRIPSSALTEARAIPGVVNVRLVKHRKRMP